MNRENYKYQIEKIAEDSIKVNQQGNVTSPLSYKINPVTGEKENIKSVSPGEMDAINDFHNKYLADFFTINSNHKSTPNVINKQAGFEMNRENYKYQIEKMAETKLLANKAIDTPTDNGYQRILKKRRDLFDQPTKIVKSKRALSRKAKFRLGAGALSASALGLGAYEYNKIHEKNKDNK